MHSDVTKRLLSEKEAQAYTGLKRGKVREFGEKINCIKRIGRRVLYDRNIIDAALDSSEKFD